jgi:AcrR family transcriptional regulator
MVKSSENANNLKAKLVEVAVAELAKPRALKLPTMRDLASGAGVAPGAAYRHFDSQEELFLTVILYLFTEMEGALKRAVSKLESSEGKAAAMAHAYVEWGTSNAGAYQLILETTDEKTVLESGQRAGLHLIAELSALLTETGEPTQASTKKAIQLWTALHGIVSLRNHKTGMPWTNTAAEQVDDLLKLFISGGE